MKLEKRSAADPAQTSGQETPQKEKRPILIYILVLFIAAFLLMTLSFLSHQRSNEEMLGQLHSNATALERLQSSLEENIRLQEQLEELEQELKTKEYELEVAYAAQEADAAYRQKQLDAMTNLYLLEYAFQCGEYERCREMIQKMEEAGQVELLVIPGAALDNPSPGIIINGGYDSPHLRFDHIKRTVEEKLAD